MVMAEIQGGGPMAHQQLPMHHHHHRVQMVMNHHMDMDLDCHQTGLEEIHPANISKDFFCLCFTCEHNIKYIELHLLDVLGM